MPSGKEAHSEKVPGNVELLSAFFTVCNFLEKIFRAVISSSQLMFSSDVLNGASFGPVLFSFSINAFSSGMLLLHFRILSTEEERERSVLKAWFVLQEGFHYLRLA